MNKISLKLTKLEKAGKVSWAKNRKTRMEFHINSNIRIEYELRDSLFSLTGNVVFADLKQCRELANKFNLKQDPAHPERYIKAGQLYAMGLIDEILHYVVSLYREEVQGDIFDTALERLETNLGEDRTGGLLKGFSAQFPPRSVYRGEKNVEQYLKSKEEGESCRALSIEETMLLSLANLNPAFKPFKFMFDDSILSKTTVYPDAIEELKAHLKDMPSFGPDGMNLWDFLRSPALACPDSLLGQLDYMRKHWGLLISKFMSRLLMSLDVINEEDKSVFFGPGPSEVLTFAGLDEYERFSPDQDWMPKTVLMAKSTLVWLFQLSQKYNKEIVRLDQIPDEELDELARRGFTGLWLIGVWERSQASKTIKQWTGNPEAAASAYSLYDYDIANELGGWGALCNLRDRCMHRGIRLGSDMVPNHTGLDSKWIVEHPDRFLQLQHPPFPTYNYNCGNLSGRGDITVQIEEHYFSRSDAAVVFKRADNRTGETRYIYHGNDGTSMPWNDTAQIDFLNPEAREAVIRTIIGVCQQFSIVRFDAAMTLAKRHIQRLWYPAPGTGGAIASRAEHAISTEEFNRRIPNEFWREVVDRCAVEAPNTLLLAEAFWMMEGYFVRTLGMHRVYNSAFMNMLKNEENDKYRATIKNTMEFDPEILKRFVNFMNNPDEDTAVAQFGKGDKYFGICTLLVTMPGLPMFGHGQIDGFEEKYGMEYRRSYKDEKPDGYLVDRHEREIFPLMKKRSLFSGSANFRIYDLYCNGGSVNENVFAYSNRTWIGAREEKALIFYNNSYYETSGWIKVSDPPVPVPAGTGNDGGNTRRDSLSEALALHGEAQYFTLLREQISNLWFIRSSKAISEDGFFIGLRGYETQVYLDVCEVEDDAKGRWARLNNDLNGRGVPCPHAAIKDIFLGDLYYRFMEILNPEFIIGLKESINKKSFADSFKTPVEEFIKTASFFITGANGSWDPWTAKDQAKNTDIKFTPVKTDAIWKEFEMFINRFKSITDTLKKTKSPLLDQITKCMAERQMLYAVALSYGVLSLLRLIIGRLQNGKGATGLHAADLAFDHWDLGRKLRQTYKNFGASDVEAWQITDLLKASLGRTNVPHSWDRPAKKDISGLSPSEFAALIIEENYLSEDFRRILGINFFNDVMWFNKEGFENAVYYSSFFFMMEGSIKMPVEERINRISGIYDALTKAEKKSEYRFDNLLDILTAKPKAGTAKKKTSGLKVPAEKAPVTKKAAPKIKKAEKKADAVKKAEPAAKTKKSAPKTKQVEKKASAVKKTKPAAKTKKSAPKTKQVEKKVSAVKKTEPATKAKKAAPKAKATVKKAQPKKAAAKKTTAKKAVSKKAAPKTTSVTVKKSTVKKAKAAAKKTGTRGKTKK
ncbi:MAG: alpha-amylase family glycosyl hydrolase [Treponema sp.]|nr:alpha-amylase family glycosyl hydrolase [Treponema sp.]